MVLCYVTARKLLGSSRDAEALLQAIASAGSAGVDWIQIREKDLPARELLEVTRSAIAVVPGATRVMINDRLDVALASGAAGVHLGAASLPVAEAVRWCRRGNAPAEFRIGVSCHNLREAVEAERAGASYIFFGPVYETPSKAQFGPPQGIERLAEVCGSVRIPVIAIGGMNEGNAAACLRAGAAGIAAIRLFQEAPDSAALSRIVAHLRKLQAVD
jgi:thiamine-phosphate pyrophosphorylase